MTNELAPRYWDGVMEEFLSNTDFTDGIPELFGGRSSVAESQLGDYYLEQAGGLKKAFFVFCSKNEASLRAWIGAKESPEIISAKILCVGAAVFFYKGILGSHHIKYILTSFGSDLKSIKKSWSTFIPPSDLSLITHFLAYLEDAEGDACE